MGKRIPNSFEPWLNHLRETLSLRRDQELFRRLQPCQTISPVECEIDGKRFLQFASNDYLGLRHDRSLWDQIWTQLEDKPFGSGASPLVTGHSPYHEQLACAIANFEGTASASLFSSGYAANVGTIASLVSSTDILYSDRLNHASIIDGCRLSKGRIEIYDHASPESLEEKLNSTRSQGRFAFIITDSIFSMDGDEAPLEALVDLAERYDAILMIDEAHATGVYGRTGAGLAEALSLHHRIPIRIGTLSKACGAMGGFAAGDSTLTAFLTNHARSMIYSTSLPVPVALYAMLAIKKIPTMSEERETLRTRSRWFRQKLCELGFDLPKGESTIVPIRAGTPGRALMLSQVLRDHGIWIPAIRPPTVPAGNSMLRISFGINHREDHFQRLLDILAKIT